VGRVANGIPRRVDRLRGLGNAVVPQVAELVGRMVIDILAKQSLQSLPHLLQCRKPREG
jgi:DNA (cytosine-5)-methyltransferase 1